MKFKLFVNLVVITLAVVLLVTSAFTCQSLATKNYQTLCTTKTQGELTPEGGIAKSHKEYWDFSSLQYCHYTLVGQNDCYPGAVTNRQYIKYYEATECATTGWVEGPYIEQSPSEHSDTVGGGGCCLE